jgi:hypothetical protein
LDEVVDGQSARTIAAVLAAVAVASCLSLILFFVVGGPFGTINDLGNGTLAVLCGVLAFALYAPGRTAATAAAVAGAATSVLGSFLVISDTTGYFLAGLISAFGFGLVGLWLVHLSRTEELPTSRFAFGAGGVMALGIVNIPGILRGMDDQDTAPTWLLAAGVCWAGTYVLLPIWAAKFARSGLPPTDAVLGESRSSLHRPGSRSSSPWGPRWVETRPHEGWAPARAG